MSVPERLETKQQRLARAQNYKEIAAWIYIGGCAATTFTFLVSPWFFVLQVIAWLAAAVICQTAEVVKEKIPAKQVDDYEASWWLDKRLPAPGETYVDGTWAGSERSIGDAKSKIRAHDARFQFLREEEPDVEKLEKELSIAFGLEAPPAEEEIERQIKETYKVPPTFPSYNRLPDYRSYAKQLKYARKLNSYPEWMIEPPHRFCDCELCRKPWLP